VEQVANDVKQATLYPSIVLFVIMCFTVFLFSFIIPKFSALSGRGSIVPHQSRFGVGDFAKNSWFTGSRDLPGSLASRS
jgi:type II secretory pathway component PulF